MEDINNNIYNPTSPTSLSHGKHPGGRPTEYKPDYPKRAFKLCLLGATDADMADYFEVDVATVQRWKIDHPEFRDSITRGKVDADAKVAQRMYQSATGYEHAEDVIMQYQGEPVIVHTTKHYPPDYKSASLWLRNRQPDKWREQQSISIDQTLTVQIGEIPSLDEIIERREQRRLERGAVDAQFEVVEGGEGSE